MENVRNVEANAAAAQECCAPAAKSGWLNSRNLLIGVVLAGGGGALVLGWDWLVAAGMASILIAAAPCLVMCALGLCMSHKAKSDQTATGTPPASSGTDMKSVTAEQMTLGTNAHAVRAEPVSAPNTTAPGSQT